MSSRRFRHELSAALPSWQKRGWLTPEAAASLRAAYDLDRPPPRTGAIVLAILGAVLITGGLILILAHNWTDLSRPLRAFIAVLPLLVSGGLGVFFLRKHPGSLACIEATGATAALSVGLAISLVAQTYHISGDLPRFLLTWALFSLGTAYVLGRSVALLLHAILGMVWAWNIHAPTAAIPGYAALLAASLPFFHPRLWGASRSAGCRLLVIPLVLCATSALCALVSRAHVGNLQLIVLPAWFALVLLIAEAPSRPLGAALRWLAPVGLSVCLLPLSFEDSWTHLRIDSLATAFGGAPAHVAVATLATLLALSVGAIAFLRRGTLSATGWLWAACGLLPFAAWVSGCAHSESAAWMLATNALVGATALTLLLLGVQRLDARRTNLGWLLLCALILCRFFDTDLSYLFRGLAFVTLGLSFLALNGLLARLKARAPAATARPAPAPAGAPSEAPPQRGEGGPPTEDEAAEDEVPATAAPRPRPAEGPVSIWRLGVWLTLVALKLSAPLSMVLRKEYTLHHGAIHRFRLAPVDPADPLVGRYMTLDFEAERIDFPIPKPADGIHDARPLFARLGTDKDGFTVITEVVTTQPDSGPWLRVTGYTWNRRVGLPFKRFYLNEELAPVVEERARILLREAARDKKPCPLYAEVRIHDGDGVILSLQGPDGPLVP